MNAPKPPQYVGYFLSEEAKKYLLKVAPPKHPNVFADHLTLAFGRHMGGPYPIGQIEELEVIGELSDERGQCVIVRPDNVKEWLAPNQSPHITISCADGIRPIYSNELLKCSPQELWRKPLHLLSIMDFSPRTEELWKKLSIKTHHSYRSGVPCTLCGDIEGCWTLSSFALRSRIKERVEAHADVREQVEQLLGIRR